MWGVNQRYWRQDGISCCGYLCADAGIELRFESREIRFPPQGGNDGNAPHSKGVHEASMSNANRNDWAEDRAIPRHDRSSSSNGRDRSGSAPSSFFPVRLSRIPVRTARATMLGSGQKRRVKLKRDQAPPPRLRAVQGLRYSENTASWLAVGEHAGCWLPGGGVGGTGRCLAGATLDASPANLNTTRKAQASVQPSRCLAQVGSSPPSLFSRLLAGA